ncbi:unnamed protein product [Blepharisma stoltei]|uniref:DNA mismatch repair proteins mutS family domain-containing protein n=1 Tax=Blepharisma stoltei TaxID=1481888 RepID=A0AAU9J8B4_9CILI|nr:unnamed protein product [Blepharisma stoltei]
MQRPISSFFTPTNRSKPQEKSQTSEQDLSLKRKHPSYSSENSENIEGSLAKLEFKSNSKPKPTPMSPPSPSSNDDEYEMPEFCRPEKIQDKSRRRPEDPEYDPSSLFIPPNQKFTPAMEQYWEIKSQHYDKIVLFKLGKFYELFYQDAIIAQQILELKWMGNDRKKAHVGFPEKVLEKNAKILVERGHKVVVVEQTETTLKNRKPKTGKAVGREVTDILTKATYTAKFNCENYEPTYLLSLIEVDNRFGVCFVDCSTSVFVVGDVDFQTFKTILAQSRPSEVIYHPQFILPSTIRLLKSSHMPPQLSKLRSNERWNHYNLNNFFPAGLPEVFRDLPENTALKALVGCCSYLNEVFLSEKILPNANYFKYEDSVLLRASLVLDSQALQHLQIIEANNGVKISKEGSLYEFMDKCSTSWGKRKLKSWLISPLLDVNAINERLDAVEELSKAPQFIEKFDKAVKKYPDMERLLSKISTYSIKTNSKAVYFEDVSAQKIKEFNGLLTHLSDIHDLMIQLDMLDLESSRIQKLTKFHPEGLFPEIKSLCKEYENAFFWLTPDQPEPAPGKDETFERLKLEVELVKDQLSEILSQEKARFNNHSEVTFVDSKFRYELEIPLHLVKDEKPDEYEETSARQGYQRYYTKTIKRLVDQLEILEEQMRWALGPYLASVLKHFYDEKDRWARAISIVAEIDCLCSFAKLASKSLVQLSRPEFVIGDQSYLEIKGLVHPILATKNPLFVPNDVLFTSENPCYVLTGPNMGGKSTVLRQAGIAVIMAQIGSFVPCEYMKFYPVDYIFTRLGAADSLIEGKSTYFMEIEEASKVLYHGTPSSLVIMDELGRGTSTSDGASIALGFLKYVTSMIKPRTLFTTHYHMIISDIAELPGVVLVFMDSFINEVTQNVTFLYKLKQGICPKSYGLNVARSAGIFGQKMVVAQLKANEIEKNFKQIKIIGEIKKLKRQGLSPDDILEKLKQLNL